MRSNVAGRLFEGVLIDVGFGDPLESTPDRLTGPALFEFAGIAPIEVPTLPLEMHLAEKLHAYSRTYADGRRSSRAKDLIDIQLIGGNAEFVAARLRAAVVRTFDHRGSPTVPSPFPPPPVEWATPYRKLALEVGVAPNLNDGHASAAAFLDPILGGTAPDGASWDPLTGEWSD